MADADRSLAERAKQGDQEAFAALVSAYQGRAYGLALRMLRDPEEAADAAQEAFLRCYASLGSYKPSHSFGPWLYRIVYNHCLDVLRRRKRSPVQDLSFEEGELSPVDTAPDPSPGVEETVERGEEAEMVRAALEQLSEEHRHVLTLRYMLDLSYAEIASVLELPQSTVNMRLHHAKAALRTRLRDTVRKDDVSS